VSADPSAERLYERVGGREFFVGLVDRFYAGVATDEVLRPMYDENLAPAQERLTAFLSQYFGGGSEYEDLRGSPIDEKARDAWLDHMGDALDVADVSSDDRDELWRYFVTAANFFMNQGGLSFTGG
jgi:hemoglobin